MRSPEFPSIRNVKFSSVGVPTYVLVIMSTSAYEGSNFPDISGSRIRSYGLSFALTGSRTQLPLWYVLDILPGSVQNGILSYPKENWLPSIYQRPLAFVQHATGR